MLMRRRSPSKTLIVVAALATLLVTWSSAVGHAAAGEPPPNQAPTSEGKTTGEQTAATLWPEIEAFRSGYLEVTELHQIYYEVSGNPEGIPVFFLHGGPGGASSPRKRRLADPERCLIVQHDQRGAGRSLPAGELKENTTQDLVTDIERLRLHLGVQGIVLVGGSWGTTLALAYAESYPDQVKGIVLRGLFLATEKEIDHIFHGGAAAFFPDAYQELLSALPEPGTRPLPAYLDRLLRQGDPATRRKVARAFTRYAIRLSLLEVSSSEVEAMLDAEDPYLSASFETYYMANHAFLEPEQLLHEADTITQIPTVIINGRYDLICPPVTAYRLHQRLPRSRLVIVEGTGHTGRDPKVEVALVEAIAAMTAGRPAPAVP